MANVNEIYTFLATPAAALLSSLLVVLLLIRLGAHRELSGALSRRRLASVFILSASAYTIFILSTGELFFGIPMERMISDGFGGQRVAWLLLAVFIDSVFRIWTEFIYR